MPKTKSWSDRNVLKFIGKKVAEDKLQIEELIVYHGTYPIGAKAVENIVPTGVKTTWNG